MAVWRPTVPLRELALLPLFAIVAAIVVFWQWGMQPQGGRADLRATGIVRAIAPIESDSDIPEAHVEVELASGRTVAVLGVDVRLLGHCRVGGRINLVGGRANAGSIQWWLAPNACA